MEQIINAQEITGYYDTVTKYCQTGAEWFSRLYHKSRNS